jgi:hypothetical protein
MMFMWMLHGKMKSKSGIVSMIIMFMCSVTWDYEK